MYSKQKIIVFTGPSLHPDEASEILDANYRRPVKRGDIMAALKDNPDIIAIIDGVFHKQPAVSHREILKALKSGVTVVGGASMGALRASELDDFGMIGAGYVYNLYKKGIIESDDDVAVVFNPDTLEQLSEALVSMRYNFQTACNEGIISKKEFYRLLDVAKSIYYPKRTYNRVFMDVKMDAEKIMELRKFLDDKGRDIKREDAIAVLEYIKDEIDKS